MAVDLNMPILIVDDYKVMVRIIHNQLDEIGFRNVEEAYDGESALAMLRDGGFGLAIGSWTMAPMNGLALLRRVREDRALSKLPFILVTGEGAADEMAAARDAGASNCIARPFNPAKLKETLASVVGQF